MLSRAITSYPRLSITLVGFLLSCVVIVSLLAFANPLPFAIPDEGHRTYDVGARQGHDIAVRILTEFGGMKVKSQFHVCGLHQTVMNDDITVVMFFDKETGLSGNGISRPVNNPNITALGTKQYLVENGYTAEIREIACKELPAGNLVVVVTNFPGIEAFVYRKSVPFGGMPRPLSGLE